jgi:transposase-like protein
MNDTIRDHIAPIDRSPHSMPEAWKRTAVRIYHSLGTSTAAYIYDVDPATIRRWRDTIRL